MPLKVQARTKDGGVGGGGEGRGGRIKKPNKYSQQFLICCHLMLFRQYLELSHPTENHVQLQISHNA